MAGQSWIVRATESIAFIREIGTMVAICGTIAFFVAPPVERILVETFGVKAWYFATEMQISEENGAIVKSTRANNFYNFLWSERNDFAGIQVADNDAAVAFVLKQLNLLPGDLVYATASNGDEPTPGRADIHVTSKMRALAGAHECFRVKKVKYRKGRGDFPHNVYLKLVRTPCL
ncbi:hypothetical protein ACMU_09230 [Actibacterium mucosum KCTC 23349]|uniref:Uncharacterized protein n=1 Tax=Actibacterium mucosum KCTC 23349 TaxID=1454373 RepID=A0A037ZK83_9RHOB|nr:hypothetical protein [Actibacterium mucosum]KAJ55937.1 hypothetical protein ACMU_09230 [Actibacterium mucosum KCTC 23349]